MLKVLIRLVPVRNIKREMVDVAVNHVPNVLESYYAKYASVPPDEVILAITLQVSSWIAEGLTIEDCMGITEKAYNDGITEFNAQPSCPEVDDKKSNWAHYHALYQSVIVELYRQIQSQ